MKDLSLAGKMFLTLSLIAGLPFVLIMFRRREWPDYFEAISEVWE